MKNENASSGPQQYAQPLLRGINLARFLCDQCPFLRLTEGRDGKSGNCLGLPPVDDNSSDVEDLDHAERWWSDLPGRL